MTKVQRSDRSRSASWLAGALALAVAGSAAVVAQSRRDVQVTAKKYTYVVADATAPEIRVRQDDLVTVTLTAGDIAHSFTISDEHYRIDRRVEPGKPVVFRFRADKPGEFEIHCTLTIDERCQRQMRGKLIVAPK